ncbi:MAG TPA: hypothetical protein PKD64_18455 [Pirellulaceae bacterium]|nr:hypothetical protein [Pirellulaceae bacterium]HMO94172.1 hypothetical protein [Pirellulaceae bacterium]HMP71289.1 hypothetical protein [Pirellulaceae bacterium]
MKNPCRLILLIVATAFAVPTAYGQAVTRAEISRARYELSKVEQKIKDNGGVSIELSKSDLAAFELVRALSERDSGNPDVVELVEEARGYYNRAKGERFEITPEMLAYRSRQSDLETKLGTYADQAWQVIQDADARDPNVVSTLFPVKFGADDDVEDHTGKVVTLQDVDWESALFVQTGNNWIPVGSPTQGYYYIDGSSQEYNQLYAALQRYREQVKSQLGPRLTFRGTIKAPAMLSADAKDDKPGTPQLGWSIQVNGIHVPSVVTVVLDDDHAEGARFIGEDKLSEWRTFSVNSIPKDADPISLVKIYIDAIKEKNWELHLACLDPSLRLHDSQLHGLRYTWELQQKGLENFHCHAEPTHHGPIIVTKGFIDDGLESFFGDGIEREPATGKEERVIVTVQLFDERGVQTVRPRYLTLIRYNDDRWYIWSGMTLTF